MFQRAEHPIKLDCLAPARRFFESCLAGSNPSMESLWVAHVDHQARCLHVTRHEGDETGVLFPIQAILTDAIRHHSSGIVLAHNHPSGDATPSDSDCKATRRLATAADAIDCTLLDHLVLADGECTSLRRMGLL